MNGIVCLFLALFLDVDATLVGGEAPGGGRERGATLLRVPSSVVRFYFTIRVGNRKMIQKSVHSLSDLNM